MDLSAGQPLGPYRIVEPIAGGGMTRVFLAVDGDGRQVVIKLLPVAADSASRARFEREARLLARLRHPNIVGLIDAGRENDQLYLVLPLVRCGDLATLIARNDGPLPLGQVRHLALQLADALDHAHASGVVHRDLKPANVLLDERGNALLADFGIALAGDGERLTQLGQAIGSPEYLAPEQIDGTADARSDLYSLGLIVYEMATGRRPFEAHSAAEWLEAQRSAIVPAPSRCNPALPPAFDALLLRLLDKVPARRIASAADFARELRAALPEEHAATVVGTRPASADPPVADATAGPSAPPPIASPRKRGMPHPRAHRIFAIALGVFALVALGVGLMLIARGGRLVHEQRVDTLPAPAPTIVATPAQDVRARQPPGQVAPPVGVYDDFDTRQHDGAFDTTRWRLNSDDTRVRHEQRGGAMMVTTQSRENGMYATFPSASIDRVIVRLRLERPVRASEAMLGVSVSIGQRPDAWVGCYLSATRGALRADASCTDSKHGAFPAGRDAAIDDWRELALRFDRAGGRVELSVDGERFGDLPFDAGTAPADWYVLLSGWSEDNQPMLGAIDWIAIERAP